MPFSDNRSLIDVFINPIYYRFAEDFSHALPKHIEVCKVSTKNEQHSKMFSIIFRPISAALCGDITLVRRCAHSQLRKFKIMFSSRYAFRGILRNFRFIKHEVKNFCRKRFFYKSVKVRTISEGKNFNNSIFATKKPCFF